MPDEQQETTWFPDSPGFSDPPPSPVGLGATDPTTTAVQTGTTAASPAPIVISPPAVAPVVVTTKQGVSFSAMILIAAGSALIGGVLVWMFAGQPELMKNPKEEPSNKWEPTGNGDYWKRGRGGGVMFRAMPPRRKRKARK
jgi:hypothetical protein